MSNDAMVDIIVITAPAIAAAVVWIIRMEMRLRFLITQHNECKKERQEKEEALLRTVQSSAVDIAIVRTDVSLVKEMLLSGKRPPIIVGDE